MRAVVALVLACACATPRGGAPDAPDDEAPPPRIKAVPVITDVAVEAGVQAGGLDTFHRGRACIAADFDLDGRTDLYVGNPGDRSYVQRNLATVGGIARFAPGRLVFQGELSWAASAADVDNDGDPDLFVSNGGNEGRGYDRLFRNGAAAGQLRWDDVTARAGIAGPVNPATGRPVPVPSGNGVWADYDRDGDLDLFVSQNYFPSSMPPVAGRNHLWQNQGDGTFVDVTAAAGLGASLLRSRHSAWLDVDNDGDLDLYENNYLDPNVLWRNLLVETGQARFVDVTATVSARGANIGDAIFASFASAVADMNHDGWTDIVVFSRPGFQGDCAETPLPGQVPLEGHHLLLNLGPQRGFVDVGDLSGLNVHTYYRDQIPAFGLGVMGCQVGDVDADGLLDVFVGNGGPLSGERNLLYGALELRDVNIAGVGTVAVPFYADWTQLIDFPAPEDPGLGLAYPTYPYRTHGSCLGDFDQDGLLELYVTNGGPARMADTVREPDRLFDFAFDAASRPDSVSFRLRGDGVHVPADPVGATVVVRVRQEDGSVRYLPRTLYAGHAFSAQNTFEVFVGLGFADAILDVEVRWPDGTRQRVPGVQKNTHVEIAYP